MNTPLELDLMASDVDVEFDPEENPQHYDVWFRAKVAEALADEAGFLPHDAAMADVDAMLAAKRAQRAAG